LLLLHESGVCGLVLLVAELQLQALPDLRDVRVYVCAELGEGFWGDWFGWRGLRVAHVGRREVEYLGRSLRLLLLCLCLGWVRVV
jgi:hypothetical protein